MAETRLVTSAHAPDLEVLRGWLERMVAALRFREIIVAVVMLVTKMHALNTELVRQVADLRRKRPRSETLERLACQLSLPFANAGLAGARKPAEQQARAKKKSRRGRHPGRAALPAHLPRIEQFNRVPDAERSCPNCSTEMTTVGFDVTEVLEVIPAQLVVIRRHDETVACPKDDTIVSAHKPAAIVERGKLGTRLIVEAVADKFIEHLPTERQCTRWARAGVDIAPQTLGRNMACGIDLLAPLSREIQRETRAAALLATDATGIPVLDEAVQGGIFTGTMWCWVGDGRWVHFFYARDGNSDSVRAFLGKELRRSVQCDGTSITTFIERAGGTRPGCWSHGRRRLAAAARGGDSLALEGLRIIGRLFAVEKLSKKRGDSPEQRKARRQRCSAPVLARLRAWVTEKRALIPPKTPLGRALGYLHRQWTRLTLFLTDGRIELTNNRVERELRRLVCGRKNWLFTSHDINAERSATILTVLGTCIAQRVNPRAYLHQVTKLILDGWPNAELRDLLPDRLAARYPELRLPEPQQLAPAPAIDPLMLALAATVSASTVALGSDGAKPAALPVATTGTPSPARACTHEG